MPDRAARQADLAGTGRSAGRASRVNRGSRLRLCRYMIRALGLLTLTLIAACIAHSRAAPPPRQQVCVEAAEGPIDPYGPSAEGDPQFAAAGRGQLCPPGRTCSFECDQGGCAFTCAEGSTCNVECDGGNCQISCGVDATCNVECDGGRCGTGCGDGASCNLECDGGSCATACAPEASCNVECDGGNCAS